MTDQNSATDSYLTDQGALSYLEFISSPDGQIFQQVQGDAIFTRLGRTPNMKILDAGCGPGWLSDRLIKAGHQVEACDASPLLTNYAKTSYPGINFTVADLTKTLPYQDEQFDIVICSMAALDLANQKIAFADFRRVLKPGGKLIATIVNPYYGYPVGVWKRGILRFLLRQMPILKLRPYQFFARDEQRGFKWSNNHLTSYFYTLPEQLNSCLQSGFHLTHLQDIMLATDDKKYSLKYRLYRYPIYLLIEFLK